MCGRGCKYCGRSGEGKCLRWGDRRWNRQLATISQVWWQGTGHLGCHTSFFLPSLLFLGFLVHQNYEVRVRVCISRLRTGSIINIFGYIINCWEKLRFLLGVSNGKRLKIRLGLFVSNRLSNLFHSWGEHEWACLRMPSFRRPKKANYCFSVMEELSCTRSGL